MGCCPNERQHPNHQLINSSAQIFHQSQVHLRPLTLFRIHILSTRLPITFQIKYQPNSWIHSPSHQGPSAAQPLPHHLQQHHASHPPLSSLQFPDKHSIRIALLQYNHLCINISTLIKKQKLSLIELLQANQNYLT